MLGSVVLPLSSSQRSRLERKTGHLLLMAILSLVTLVGACGDNATEPTAPPGASAVTREAMAVEHGERVEAAEALALNVALALADPQARAAVISAMRGSGFNEHKLLLDSFLTSSTGRAMTASARSRGGASEAELATLLAAFPDGLDFYVPSDGQRRSWAGSGSILVAGVADVDATEARAFDTEGNEMVISSLELAGYDAVIAIHPAEPRIEKAVAQPGGGATIEDEPQIAAAGGSANQVCQVDCGEPPPCPSCPPPPPPPSSPKTRVTSILPDFDDGILGGDLELYFVTGEVGNPSNQFESQKFDAEPYVNNTWLNVTTFNAAASTSLELRAVLWESDGLLGLGDDEKGEPWPVNITGGGNFASFDPFTQIFWAEYNVVVNQ